MSQSILSILEAAAEASTGWEDETRVAFDKRFSENMARKIVAYEAALADLREAAEEVNKTIRSLDLN